MSFIKILFACFFSIPVFNFSKLVTNKSSPTKSILELEKHVFELSVFQLCALHELVTISGSLILSLAVINEFLCERTAWEASQVEEKWQVDHWGSDMDAQKATDEKRNSFYQAVQFFKVS